MHILLVPDKFKGSLTAQEVIDAIKKGVFRASPEIQTSSFVLSDGGDGFLEAIAQYKDLEEIWVETVDPLGRPIRAPYLFHAKAATAYIELSQASGMPLLKPSERDVMTTSTLGTGIQIRNALERKAKHIYIGLGGSATNDAGLGIARALGYVFRDDKGNEIFPTGVNLNRIKEIDATKKIPQTQEISFYAINDVDNPLYGPYGAAYIYAAQKGADSKDIAYLDAGLKAVSILFSEVLQMDYDQLPGSGAAGGTAFGLKACFNATYISGTKFLMHLAEIEPLLQKSKIDLIITGEGKIDRQTQNGKLIKGIIDLGKAFNISVAAVCGKLDLDEKGIEKLGLNYAFALQDENLSDAYCMTHAAALIEERIYHFINEMDVMINR